MTLASKHNLFLLISMISLIIFPPYFSGLFSWYTATTGMLCGSLVIVIITLHSYFIKSVMAIFEYVTLIVFLLCVHFLTINFFFDDVDHIRFVGSLLIFIYINYLGVLIDHVFIGLPEARIAFQLRFISIVLLCMGYWSIIFPNPDFPKSVGFFYEPSDFSLIFSPFLFYFIYNSKNYFFRIIIYMLALYLCFMLSSTTFLISIIIITAACFPIRMISIMALLACVIFIINHFDIDYYVQRITLDTNSGNMSVLLYRSGLETAVTSFKESCGLGMGFQQMGIVGKQSELFSHFTELNLYGLQSVQFDGGTLSFKLITEFGLFAIVILVKYCHKASILWRSIKSSNDPGHYEVFMSAVFIMYSINLFVRDDGYFSVSSLLFISSIHYFFNRRFKYLPGFNLEARQI